MAIKELKTEEVIRDEIEELLKKLQKSIFKADSTDVLPRHREMSLEKGIF